MSYPGYLPPGAYPPPPAYGVPPPPVGYGYPPPGYPQLGAYPPVSGYPPHPGTYPPPGYPPPPVAPYGGAPGYGGFPGSAPPPGGSTSSGPEKKKSSSDAVKSSQTTTPATTTRPHEKLTVKGCQHGTVGEIVRGTFVLIATNHSKPVYKKSEKANDLDVLLYYWDDRDGPSFCGWWFGPKVGGDQVWAYHPDRSLSCPPTSGWKVPYDGPIDATFLIEEYSSAGSESKNHKSDSKESQKEDDEKKKRFDEKKRAEEQKEIERRQKETEKRQKEEAKKAEDAKKRQEEESKRKLEEADRKKREEEQRYMDAETRKQEDIKRKREAEERRRVEQKSMLAIRKVIQKVRAATPENFADLQAELEAEMAKELCNLGNQAAKIKEESEKGLEQARKRIDQLAEQRRKENEKLAAEEAKKMAAEQHARNLVQELCDLVSALESQAERLKDLARPLDEDSCAKLLVSDVEATSIAVEEAGMESKRMTKACTDFILTRGQEMKDPNPTPQGQPPSENKQMLAKVLQRINDCTKSAEATILNARGAKEKAAKRALALEKTRDIEALFYKYDKDKDDALSRKEVLNYAKTEHKCVLLQETVDSIWKNMVDPLAKGVKIEQFPWLKIVVGVAREVARDKTRLAERLEKEQVIVGMKDDLKASVKEAGKAVGEADKEISKAEKQVQQLGPKAKAMPVNEMELLADETDNLIEIAKLTLASARQEIDSLSDGLEDRFQDDLKLFLTQEAKQLELKLGRMDGRILRTVNLSERFRAHAVRKKHQELQRLRERAVKVLRYNQKLRNLSSDAFFDLIDANGDGEIDEADWTGFFANADMEIQILHMELTPEEMEKARSIRSDESLALKEMQGSDIQADATSETGKDQMDADKKDNNEDGKDATEDAQPNPSDSVLLSADQLSTLFVYLLEKSETALSRDVFFRILRCYMKVVQDTVMTSGKSISTSTVVKRLEVNEVVEIIDGPLKDPALGIMRILGKTVADGTEGWISVTGSKGSSYLVDGGNLFKVLRETNLTESFTLNGEAASDKQLKEGVVLEVYEWPRKEEASGLMRLKGKVRNDGAVGWVTLAGSDGSAFLEIV